METVRALSSAFDLTGPARDALLASARAPTHATAVEELSSVSVPLPLTVLLGRDGEMQTPFGIPRRVGDRPHAEDLLRRLEGDVLLSTVGPRDLPERQQTMNTTVAWSDQLLSPDVPSRRDSRFREVRRRCHPDTVTFYPAGNIRGRLKIKERARRSAPAAKGGGAFGTCPPRSIGRPLSTRCLESVTSENGGRQE